MDDVVLSELRQPDSRLVPRHEHELAYVTVILAGHYYEGDHGKLNELAPMTAVFNPSGVRHSTVIGPAGAFFFTVEFRRDALEELGLRLPESTVLDGGAGPMFWPGLSLYTAFKSQTASPLALEAQVLEMLARITRLRCPEKEHEKPAPRWFRRVKERLHDGFRDSLRVRDLALDAGVHPVHLARVFRQIERQTPGEYQQRLQLGAACRLLRDPEWPLAAIAAECGFADQSHLTRVFRRMTGTTPARFRKMVVPERHSACA